MKELAVLHDKYLNRPTLDDVSDEELAIEHTSQELTHVKLFIFLSCFVFVLQCVVLPFCIYFSL